MNIPERPTYNDSPEKWAVFYAAKATAAVARGDERAARDYARFAAAQPPRRARERGEARMKAFFDYIDSVPTAAAIVGIVIGVAVIETWKFFAWRANRRRA